VLLRLRALLSDGEITIVDAAAIDFAENIPARPENGRLRRGGYMREMDEVLAYIQHCRFSDGEGMVVFRNCGRIVLGVGKYPPYADALLRELTI
jgi:hypothetical protein